MDPNLILEQVLQESLSLRTESYRDKSFPEQDLFVLDENRFIAAQCSRRAGKSSGLGLRFLRTMQKHPGCWCPYIALTRESAHNIMWPVLQELDARFHIGCEFTESNLTVTHPNGSRLQLFGADMKNFIRRLKGTKTPGAAIDEAQDFGPHISSLVDDVLSPALTDYEDSWLAVTGTPGPVPIGYFYEITAQRKQGFSLHQWTLLQNPYLPNAHQFIEELKKKRQWPEDHPTLLREWKNQWVLDLQSLLIRYNVEKNHYDELPPAQWVYLMGVDVGYEDADALCIVAWSEKHRCTYLIEEMVTHKQGVTELAGQIRSLMNKYQVSKIVMDEGGLGKKMAEEMRRRHHLPIQAADKQRKMETIEFLNDELYTGNFRAKSSSRFAQDSYLLQIDWEKTTPSRIVVKDSYHSDIIDAVIYAFKESPAFTWQKEHKKPKWGTPEWAAEEVTDMERAAEEFFKAQEEAGNFGL